MGEFYKQNSNFPLRSSDLTSSLVYLSAKNGSGTSHTNLFDDVRKPQGGGDDVGQRDGEELLLAVVTAVAEVLVQRHKVGLRLAVSQNALLRIHGRLWLEHATNSNKQMFTHTDRC